MQRILNARPDTIDFRDQMFIPSLVETPIILPLQNYQKLQLPILDQGKEGACTGFGLAAVIHYLLHTRMVVPEKIEISPWMLYSMAKRYDEWPGENYDGSSARGAVKGWHKHGVCHLNLWPKESKDPFTHEQTLDAMKRPLGAYFRVNHKNLVAMHTALAEVGVLYATAHVHDGWRTIGPKGIIEQNREILGGHAFVIVGYNQKGFWIQNSWGQKWGREGFGLLSYADWLENGSDVWVARLGVPTELGKKGRVETKGGAISMHAFEPAYSDIRAHIVTIGNDGVLSDTGTYGTSKEEVKEIFQFDIPRITKKWKKKRIVIWIHGGLISERAATFRIAEYREAMLDAKAYLLAFNWRSDYWTTLANILKDAVRRRRPEGFLDASKDFMLDRLDDALEPLARILTGRAEWKEMKENALLATQAKNGGVRFTLDQLALLTRQDKSVEIHLICHSAGSVLGASALQYLATRGKIKEGPLKGKTGLGVKVASCTLWAPACPIDLFKTAYLPLVGRTVHNFSLFTLTEEAEKDDHCAHIYHKSLLYLVSSALERYPRIPFIHKGVPLLGIKEFIDKDPVLTDFFKKPFTDWVIAPNTHPLGSSKASRAHHHGDFDDDDATFRATMARILNAPSAPSPRLNPLFPKTLKDRRAFLNG